MIYLSEQTDEEGARQDRDSFFIGRFQIPTIVSRNTILYHKLNHIKRQAA